MVGGLFASLFALTWWPWAFLSFAIALAGLAVAASFIIPDPPKKPEFADPPLREKVKSLDLPGAVVGITALVVFNLAWTQASIVGWQQAYVYVTMIIATTLVPLFFYIEFRVAKAPLVPFEAFSADVGFVLTCVACGWASFGTASL